MEESLEEMKAQLHELEKRIAQAKTSKSHRELIDTSSSIELIRKIAVFATKRLQIAMENMDKLEKQEVQKTQGALVYKCPMVSCKNIFSYKDERDEHLAITHGLVIKCNYSNCNEIFAKKSALQEHLRKSHYLQIKAKN